MIIIEKKAWGGIRQGSGRPALNDAEKKQRKQIYFTNEIIKDIESYGKGKTFSSKALEIMEAEINRRKSRQTKTGIPKTVAELFSGVGGFRLGLSKSSTDWSFVWFNQWEPTRKVQDAYDCYVQHFGTKAAFSNEDINKVPKDIIPNHNLLVGGFPCQDYSVARTGAEGIHGKKGVLWWDIHEILKVKSPKFVLLENVDRLLKSPASQRGRDFGIILACFFELGYSVEWRVINAADYGFPQKRRRIFIFAFRNDTNYANKLESSSPYKWLYETGFFQAEFPVLPSEHPSKRITFEYKDLVDLSDCFKFEFQNAGLMTNGTIYSERTVPDYKGTYTLLKDILQKDVDKKYYLNGSLKDWEFLKGSKQLMRKNKSGHEYKFSEGAIPFPDPIDRPARTMLTSESSKNRSTHIIEDPTTRKIRLLTPIEAERLNGFPDDWTNTGMSERFRYFCMGNALVVGLIEKMGRELNYIFANEE